MGDPKIPGIVKKNLFNNSGNFWVPPRIRGTRRHTGLQITNVSKYLLNKYTKKFVFIFNWMLTLFTAWAPCGFGLCC